MFYVGITDLEKSMLNFTSRQKKTPVGWEEVLFTSKAVRFCIHCKNSGVVVTPNWGVSKLCTSDTPWGVMIL